MNVRTTITASCTYELDINENYTNSDGSVMTLEEIRELEDEYAFQNLMDSDFIMLDVQVGFVD